MLSQTLSIETRLPVMESFYTIQGEGYHQGRAAYFIRLGGCDVGCVWCDVKGSWDASKHPLKSVEELINDIRQTPAELVVITGGEPLLHDLTNLTEVLKWNGFQTNLETSGSSKLTGKWDWICLSPKKFKAPLEEVVPLADELKVIIYNKSDFDWAEKFAARTRKSCKLFLQPEWDRSSEMTPLIIDYIKQNPQWEFSLQLHKYIHVP